MTIVADINNPGQDESQSFLAECMVRMAFDHPEHQFIIFSANEQPLPGAMPPNLQYKATGFKIKNNILDSLWYNYQLPSLLNKAGADLFISATSLSMKTGIPQVFIAGEKKDPDKGLKKKIAAKAAVVICFSETAKAAFTKLHVAAHPPVQVIVPGVAANILPLNPYNKNEIRNTYTNGREYFLYSGNTGPADNMINLLKGFSFFKKRQQSNMCLVIALTGIVKKNAFLSSLETYKYRQDVVVVQQPAKELLAALTGSAYAFVNMTPGRPGSELLEAAVYEVPVITNADPALKELFGDAALYADTANQDSVAQQLMLVYKDENTRDELIKKGTELSSIFTMEKAAARLWQVILEHHVKQHPAG